MKRIFEEDGGKYIKVEEYYVPDLGQFNDEQELIDNIPKEVSIVYFVKAS